MYGKVVLASGGAYLLTFETGILTEYVGIPILVASGWIVITDFYEEGPSRRMMIFLDRVHRMLQRCADRAEQRMELRRIAREELAANNGIVMNEDLKPEDCEWLRDQAALAIARYEAA